MNDFKNQLIPPPGMEPQLSPNLTSEQCIRAWMELMETEEQLLLARLRNEIGPDGDLRRAHREWYAKEMEEHDRM